ncbi:hypothetical protein GCM10007147_45990 [Nocardiopsis kunsanensis]|uniref:Uncharacterized protein n=1 Tax=Nocardiopsis kunsanensis TaxID=141693 RepID=A0A918XLB0_9ACTN|nr:hypothetical protein [Nocardiopsis kunsanensis]GHD37789.1 hypothetical protein GCM10007147_45990 [Nocardiopsis kunsanensis]
MGTHILIGTLVLALTCFAIGILAGAPDLIGRRRRDSRHLREDSPRIVARPERPVIYPDLIERPERADMQIDP